MMMKFLINPTKIVFVALLVSLVACSSRSSSSSPPAGTPIAAVVPASTIPASSVPAAAVLAARATIAPEIPQFPRSAVTCGMDRAFFTGFTRPYYVKSANSFLFHRRESYSSEPKSLARVGCFINAGIFVENLGDKPLKIPYSTIADMARNIIYASCNRKTGNPAGRVNGLQTDTRDNFVVMVAYSLCRKGPHRGTSILPIETVEHMR